MSTVNRAADRYGACCDHLYSDHEVVVPEDEAALVQRLCTECSECQGWQE